MIISTYAEVFDKMKHPFIIKTQQVRNWSELPWLDKEHLQNPYNYYNK